MGEHAPAPAPWPHNARNIPGLLQYEAIFGRGFVSCGGEAAARQLLPRLALTPRDRVLDVGCGTGGAAALMSGEYGAAVHGLDLSVNCLLTCLQRSSLGG
jgi:phosphoethanolamine N-methyltransferase